jgi:hypothetical protein
MISSASSWYSFASTPRIPTVLSAYRIATCKAAENDYLERRNSSRPCVPSHVAFKAERGGNELFWSPWKNVSTLARAASSLVGVSVISLAFPTN